MVLVHIAKPYHIFPIYEFELVLSRIYVANNKISLSALNIPTQKFHIISATCVAVLLAVLYADTLWLLRQYLCKAIQCRPVPFQLVGLFTVALA